MRSCVSETFIEWMSSACQDINSPGVKSRKVLRVHWSRALRDDGGGEAMEILERAWPVGL